MKKEKKEEMKKVKTESMIKKDVPKMKKSAKKDSSY